MTIHGSEPLKFAYWVPNVSGGLVISNIEQRTGWDIDYNIKLAKIAEPMLVIIGDEDESTHGLAVHLKKNVLRCGVLELPKTGHTMNLEEPAAFNAAVQDFLHAVENGTNVAEPHRRTFVIGNDDGLVLIAGKKLIVGANGVGLPRAIDHALGLIYVCLGQRRAQVLQAQPVRR